jgi:hypothetical protein
VTLAYDRTTGALLGQLSACLPPTTLKTGLEPDADAYVLLTRDGYVTVETSTVRLETVR